MKTVKLGISSLVSSRLAYGCWRVAGTSNPAEVNPDLEAAGRRSIAAAYDAGYTLFDNADIYCRGAAERILGQALKDIPGMRERVLVATKCGIRYSGDPNPDSPYRFDFSAPYIVAGCDRSLARLGIETIDLYLLHRPDYLADPHEVAGAFAQLQDAGKVRFFGVSNFAPTQVAALQAACPMPLVVNQVEISLARLNCLADGTLDQCLAETITPLAWSPLAGGLLGEGAKRLLPAQQKYQTASVVAVLDDIAKARGASRMVVAMAWLLKHPSGILPIVGSSNPVNIRAAVKATELDLTREEWYRLLVAARGEPLP